MRSLDLELLPGCCRHELFQRAFHPQNGGVICADPMCWCNGHWVVICGPCLASRIFKEQNPKRQVQRHRLPFLQCCRTDFWAPENHDCCRS
jgi:hypothetical protein